MTLRSFTLAFKAEENSDKSFKALVGAMNELQSRLNTVAQVFENIDKAATLCKSMVDDPSKMGSYHYHTFIGQAIGSTLKAMTYYSITEEQHQALFYQSEIRKEATAILKELFDKAIENLNQKDATEKLPQIIKDLTLGIGSIIDIYLEAMQGAAELQNNLLKLPEGLVKELDKIVFTQTNKKLTDLAAGAFQHLGRIPLMLKTLVEVTGQSLDESVQKQSQLLARILDEIVKPRMDKINKKIELINLNR